MRCSLIIPCYNEAANIPLLLAHCQPLYDAGDIEILLVDNGSTDKTKQILQEHLGKYPHCRSLRLEHNRGYGYGILQGLRAAKSEILGWTHADLQTDPRDVLRALEHFDVSSESIFVKGKRYGRPISDTLFTWGMSAFESALLRTLFWDINAQPTLFHRSFFKSWSGPPNDFSLDLFAYYYAKQKHLNIRRIDVQFGARAHGVSSWNTSWKNKKKFIKRTVDFSLKLRQDLYHADHLSSP